MEWSQIYSKTQMVTVGSSYGRRTRVYATDGAGAPKQRSAVAFVLVASL